MASHELDILIRAKGALQAAREIGKVDSSIGKLGRTATTGARTAVGNIAKVGVVAGAGIAIAVRAGLESLAELEDATTSVDGAIAQLGLTGQVTSGQIATWANDIETNIDAAFDDKEIVAATATLLRFGKLTPKNIRPAMEVITDLATKTGSVESAATLLAKALADPEKAAGKLARSGVILTKVEQEQIKAFVKAGDAASAQEVILASLAKTTAGAAKASAGPYRDSLNILRDVTEDAQRALAEGFLPVITKVRDILSRELAKPETLNNIREFGKGLAEGLDSLITIAKNLPWATIGASLQLAGAGAKTVLGIFTSMPPWVQTAVLTGWGLNKLTGGAVGSIAAQLGGIVIDQFKGRGSTPANPLFVAQVGGGPGGPWNPTSGGKDSGLMNVLKNLPIIGAGIAGAELANVAGSGIADAVKQALPTGGPSEAASGIVKTVTGALTGALGIPNLISGIQEIAGGVGEIISVVGKPIDKTTTAVETMRGKMATEIAKTTSMVGMSGDDVSRSARAAGTTGASATHMARSAIVSAIHSIPQPMVSVNVSSTSVTHKTTVIRRAGPTGGSRNTRGVLEFDP